MHSAGSKEIEDDGAASSSPSCDLFVGNISTVATVADLMEVFGKHGALDAVTSHASRSYAIVFFKNVDGARAAKDALQGALICGSAMKIKFARPEKPGTCLWIGAVSSLVTKEQLEEELSKFGNFDEFKFFRDRNSGLVDYYNLEDAITALKNMNGKHLGGDQLRVEFLRSPPSRKEKLSDVHDVKGGYSKKRKRAGCPERTQPDLKRNFHESSQFGAKRHPPSQMLGEREKGQPSKILWIGYPPSVQVDEQMLYNSMILFGEIERIKCFPSRHYSFVEFRSIDEARRAKEGLQGRLFNDPRIKILFSSSELGPSKENPTFSPGFVAAGSDMFFNDPPVRPWPMELIGPHPMPPSNFEGPTVPNDMPGLNIPRRPFGPHRFDPHLGGPFSDVAHPFYNFPDSNLNSQMVANWRRHSPPAPSILPSSAQGVRPPTKLMPVTWDALETDPFQSDSKRPRLHDLSFIDETPHHARNWDNEGSGGPFGHGLQLNGDASGMLSHLRVENKCNPVGLRGPSIDHPSHIAHQGLPNNDICWHGIIAKGGTPVCHARCVPIGKGMDSQLPEVVNCSARTGLDMLAKHYAEASGFDIVYFLPDSEEDFSSYTEFLHYLGTKNRAGVAKLDDGATLFLVPPSDFLSRILNGSVPERLYGLVLKLSPKLTNRTVQQPQQPLSLPSHYIDSQQLPPQNDYVLAPKEYQVSQAGYYRNLHEESKSKAGGPKPLLVDAGQSHAMQPASSDHVGNPAVPSQAAVSLTPELIATLAALIPAKTQSISLGSSQLPVGSSTQPASSSVTLDDGTTSQGRNQEHQATVSGGPHNLGHEKTSCDQNQFNSQAPSLSQYSTSANVANGLGYSMQAISVGAEVPEPSLNRPQVVSSTRPMNNFVIPPQAGQYSVCHANQRYQFDESQNFQNHSMENQQQTTVSALVEGVSQATETGMTIVTEKVNAQVPQLQRAISAPVQGSLEADADKSQRYQSTLQFAASLLLQLQQRQQQGNAQTL